MTACPARLGPHACALPAGPLHGGMHSDRRGTTWRDTDTDIGVVLQAAKDYREAAKQQSKLLALDIADQRQSGAIGKKPRSKKEVKSCPTTPTPTLAPPTTKPTKTARKSRRDATNVQPAAPTVAAVAACPATRPPAATSAATARPATKGTSHVAWPPRSRELWSRVTTRGVVSR